MSDEKCTVLGATAGWCTRIAANTSSAACHARALAHVCSSAVKAAACGWNDAPATARATSPVPARARARGCQPGAPAGAGASAATRAAAPALASARRTCAQGVVTIRCLGNMLGLRGW
jgi:hypothetical protein